MSLLSTFTPDNGAIRDLRELMFLTLFRNPDLEQFFTTKTGIYNGKKFGYVGEMEDVAKAGAGCDPEYESKGIVGKEKEWELGDWEAPIKLCYEELENTIADYTLKTGTDRADLTSNEYMDYIFMPKLENALMDAMWRMVWFGDKDAKNVTSGGVITGGIKTNLFTMADGLFKRLFAITTDNESQKTTIAANSETTKALQFSKLKEAGVATSIFDSILEDADSRISYDSKSAIFATKSLCDALTKDLKGLYKNILEWEQIFKGIKLTEYNGVKIYSIDIWDRMIAKYQTGSGKLNLPHRAVYASPSNLFVGTNATKLMSDIEVTFDNITRNNYIYTTGKIGTQTGEDELIHIAY